MIPIGAGDDQIEGRFYGLAFRQASGSRDIFPRFDDFVTKTLLAEALRY